MLPPSLAQRERRYAMRPEATAWRARLRPIGPPARQARFARANGGAGGPSCRKLHWRGRQISRRTVPITSFRILARWMTVHFRLRPQAFRRRPPRLLFSIEVQASYSQVNSLARSLCQGALPIRTQGPRRLAQAVQIWPYGRMAQVSYSAAPSGPIQTAAYTPHEINTRTK